ncbi:PP2C family serine/threonine-protein phosphatase [Actimicrobium sp. CCI2.3]|uniref:PP2C family protein-serine/threonine phosphatase n=1 Tax=Actimicrobium sp. CCI2.3 TaxID=3048616 RepID=UPI002AB3D03C|nr:PP2C family serine/threonine-protein phosphatase [Actimicrobium sp. CCI2.3]MDY7575258.1 serine/threonine-protein phosphatase [Actimicrobium sp. CCI2.3]MEB0023153.1 serine/threonine-protein phosphatase [Actimicrobium sp. CCI2.3]
MRFSVFQESQIGGRKVNQDRMGYSYTRDALLLLLADGMGGHLHGEIAATIAMETIGSLFQQLAKAYIKKPERFLEDSFFAAHREIHRYRVTQGMPETPRTTIVACLVQHNTAFWAHCGDSRLYWMRDGQLLARTRDHSQIETLIAQGRADPSERATHPDRNKLFNCLGAPNLPIVEISRRASLQAGDVILLCSDGLWGVLPDNVLTHSLQNNTIVRAIPELINSATSIAGKNSDNVTALAMMWESGSSLADPNSITTNVLMPGDMTTTIQPTLQSDAGSIDGQVDIYDDGAIEKAIEEIRCSIEKSAGILPKN